MRTFSKFPWDNIFLNTIQCQTENLRVVLFLRFPPHQRELYGCNMEDRQAETTALDLAFVLRSFYLFQQVMSRKQSKLFPTMFQQAVIQTERQVSSKDIKGATDFLSRIPR